jgi:hypothetical protein
MSATSERDEKDLSVIRQYRGLVLELAWRYWKTLPAHTKMWIDPDDLIEDAYIYILTRVGSRAWNPKRGTRMTYLYCGISSILMNFSMSQQAKKRFGYPVPLEDVYHLGGLDKKMIQWEAEEALNKIYKEASPELKAQMKKWFGPGKPRGQRTVNASQFYFEFRGLAERYRLTPNDCRKMMGAGMWMD